MKDSPGEVFESEGADKIYKYILDDFSGHNYSK